MTPAEQIALDYLRSPKAIRERCGELFELACADRLPHFRCNLDALDRTASYVMQVIDDAYPTRSIPFHSRWRHFEAGGSDRLALLYQFLNGIDPLEKARIEFDLVITSVLLDAGAGATWRYQEPQTGAYFVRSEGLAIASFYLFCQGGFSSQGDRPWQADAHGLTELTATTLQQGFQVTPKNPLVGIEGRLALLQTLGSALFDSPRLFGAEPRLGNLADYLVQQSNHNQLAAPVVLQAVLMGLGKIWSGRLAIAQTNLGDVWRHTALPDRGIGSQLVPFHKLSQWLTYSLLEPLQRLGLEITQLDELTGLAEYRNGGLCLDLGLLEAKHPSVMTVPHAADAEVIVEWRSLTVILLDRIANAIRQHWNLSQTELPLVKVLEGGTWAAGRRIAQELRGGTPPIQLISDGTVF